MKRELQIVCCKAWRALLTAALLALIVAGVAVAAAGPWKPAAGTGTSYFVPSAVTYRGPDTLITINGGGGMFLGALHGAYTLDQGIWVIRADGSSTLQGTGLATAAIGDCGAVPGGAHYKVLLYGQAHPDGSVSFSGTAQSIAPRAADYRIAISGLIPAGAATSTFTYTGRYRCARNQGETAKR